jgi:hypothetical protein
MYYETNVKGASPPHGRARTAMPPLSVPGQAGSPSPALAWWWRSAALRFQKQRHRISESRWYEVDAVVSSGIAVVERGDAIEPLYLVVLVRAIARPVEQELEATLGERLRAPIQDGL